MPNPPDNPGYINVPFTPDPTQATQPLKQYEAVGYRIVPGTVYSFGGKMFVFMQYGYGSDTQES
jgi:hypothetical protein